MKLLLTSVFGPYGVNDAYGEKENKMELFHNQVTREQGIFSYRFNHPSHGLYFMAANVDVPTTVLDFPTIRRFKKELKKGYDYIGISFIVPNFEKAKKMAELIRQMSPKTKIILGGHGVQIPNIETLIEHDCICRGEGVRFLRELFHEDPNKPIRHSHSHSSFNREVMGVPWAPTSGILITGVGCPNRCRFCATSHFFGDYIPFFKTGKEIFDVCCDYEDKMGITDFGILDENFLKSKDRALQLLETMEREKRYFSFAIFSSAETLTALGDLDLLVRLGVTFIWIGVESKKEIYEKNKGIDFHRLIAELQRRGIAVMASAILFLEDHDQKTIWDDIEFATSLKADYLQFMQLGPIPGTALYRNYEQAGKLLPDAPLHTQHGQRNIWFRHEHFTPDESNEYLKRAFRFDYEKNGPSLLRAIWTSLQGYEYCLNHTHPEVKRRAEQFRPMLELMRYFLPASGLFSRGEAAKTLLARIKRKYEGLLGGNGLKSMALSAVVVLFAIKEYLRITFHTDIRQPKTLYRKFKPAPAKAAERKAITVSKEPLASEDLVFSMLPLAKEEVRNRVE